MDPGSEQSARVLKALTGHALCDRCLAGATGFPLVETRAILRRLGKIMILDVVQRCEECATKVNVYGFNPPPRRPAR